MPHQILPFYNVTSRVGGGSGRSLDVMLVQYFLFKVCINGTPHFEKSTLFTPMAPRGLGPEAIFPYTGRYTPQLDQWIGTFQVTANSRGFGPLTVDGRINPAPIGWGRRSIGKGGKWYTMQALNLLLMQKATIPWGDLAQASDLPSALSDELNLIRLEDYMSI